MGQFCIIFRGKEDWKVERPGSQISIVLEDNEIQQREETSGNLCIVLEEKRGWDLYELWDSSKQWKSLRTKSVKCAVQGKMGGKTAQFQASRKVVEIQNYAVKLPWRIVTTHYVVPFSRVTSLRVETAQCEPQSRPSESKFPNQEDFQKWLSVRKKVDL